MEHLADGTYRTFGEAGALRVGHAEVLAQAGVEPLRVEEAMVMLSELAANALKHTETPAPRIMVDRIGAFVRLSVTDTGTGVPVVRPREPDRIGGNGLRIVDTLASAWGTFVHDGLGKSVWFTVPTGAPPT